MAGEISDDLVRLFAADATKLAPRLLWSQQSDLPFTGNAAAPHFDVQDGGGMIVYLDVWERDITSAQDDAIREVALGGADTSARAQIVWQVNAGHGGAVVGGGGPQAVSLAA